MSESESVKVAVLRKVLQTFNEAYGQYVSDSDRRKLGKILTVVDASIPDPEQRKAVKDIINNDWYIERPLLGGFSVHTEIRKLTETLGFDLYPAEEQSVPTLPDDYNRYEKVVKQ